MSYTKYLSCYVGLTQLLCLSNRVYCLEVSMYCAENKNRLRQW